MTDRKELPTSNRRNLLTGFSSLLCVSTMSETASAVANSPPTAKINQYPENPSAGEEVRFTGSISEDSDGEITEYYWEIEESDSTLRTAYSIEIRQTWVIGGTYDVTLTVTDDDGATDSTTKTIEVASTAPTADFSIEPLSPKPNQEVTLDGTKSQDPNGAITDYEWEIKEADGFSETTTGERVMRAWASEDTYDISLTVTDEEGKTGSVTKSITVYNEPPEPSITVESDPVKTGNSITIDASESSDPDGSIVSYSWNVDYYSETKTFSGKAIYSRWVEPGTYPVELTVTDDGGKETSTTKEVTVENRSPVARFEIETSNPTQYQPIRFNGAPSVDAESEIAAYNWTVETEEGEMPYSGQKFEHTFDTAGGHDVTLVVEDQHGGRDVTTKTLDVASKQRTTLTAEPTTPAPQSTTVSSSPNSRSGETTDGGGDEVNSVESITESTAPTKTRTNSSAVAGAANNNDGSILPEVIGIVGVGAVGLYGLQRVVSGSSETPSKTPANASSEASISDSSTKTGESAADEMTYSEAQSLRDEGVNLLSSSTLLEPDRTQNQLIEARENLAEASQAFETLDDEQKVQWTKSRIESIEARLSVLPAILESLDTVDDEVLSDTPDLERFSDEDLRKNAKALEQAIDAASGVAGFETKKLKTRLGLVEREIDSRSKEPPSQDELLAEIDQVASEVGQIPTLEEVIEQSGISKQGFDEAFDTWESALEATEKVKEKQHRVQNQTKQIEQAISSANFESATELIVELRESIEEEPEYVPIGISQRGINKLQHHLQNKVSEQVTTLVRVAESKCDECSSKLKNGSYEQAKQPVNEGIEACREAAELIDEYNVEVDVSTSDVERDLTAVIEQIEEIQGATEAAEENRNRAKSALESNDYETVETALDDLNSNIEDLRTSNASQDTITRFAESSIEIEERLATKRAEKSFNGLLGAIGFAISQAEDYIEDGSYNQAISQLDTAFTSLEEARQINEKHDLGRDDTLSERRASITALYEEANDQPAEEAKTLVEEAEETISEGIEHREADRPVEAVELFEKGRSKYQSALKLAEEYELPQEWEIRQRLSMVEEYLNVTETNLDEKRARVKRQLEQTLNDTKTALRKAKQHEEVHDAVAAKESLDIAIGHLDEAEHLLEMGLGPEPARERYQELEREAETLEQRLPTTDPDSEYRKQDLIASLQELATKLEESPRPEFINAYGKYPADAYLEEFGSWPEALAAANLDPIDEEARERRKYSRVDVLDALREVAKKVDRPPTKGDMIKQGSMSVPPIESRFADWETALQLAGVHDSGGESIQTDTDEGSSSESSGSDIEPVERTGEEEDSLPENDPSREDYIRAIRRVASETEKPVKSTDVSDKSPYGVHEFTREFGSWQDALEVADINNERRLINELQRVADELGHQPSTTEMNSHGHVSASFFTDYFGTYSGAAEEAFGDATASDSDSFGSDSSSPSEKSQSEQQETTDVHPNRAELIREMENLNDRWSSIDHKLIYSVSDYDPDDFEEEFGSVDAAIDAAGLDDTDQSDGDSTSEVETESETETPPESESSVGREELIEELQELDEEWSKIDRKLLYSVGQYHPDEYEEAFGSLEIALVKAGVNDTEGTVETKAEDDQSQQAVVDADTEGDSDGSAEDEQPITSTESLSESVRLSEFAAIGDLTPNKRSSKEIAIKIEDELYAGAKKDASFEVSDATGETVRLNIWSKHDLKVPDISDDWIVIEDVRLQEWEKDGETNRNLSSSSDTTWQKLDQGESPTGQETESQSGELLEVNGVTDAIEQSLRESGFHTRDDLKSASPEDIAEADGVSKQIAMRIKLDVGG